MSETKNELETLLEQAATEPAHRPAFFRTLLESTVWVPGSAAYPAGASTAAGFLSHFVENYHEGWLHIDCSATYRKAAVEQWSAGATGLGVRTIANLLTA